VARKQFTREERIVVFQKYNGHCAYCGCDLAYKDMQIDHFNPVYVAELHRKEVDNSFDNLMPTCRACNFYKSTHSLELFRELIQGIPKRLEKEFIFKLAVKYGIIEVKDKPIKFYFEKDGE
jgi:5-methylcytosine-specific restriction endonuclease McrA